MTDLLPEFEIEDQRGETKQFAGTVGTTAVQLPAVAGAKLEVAIIRCPTQTPNTVFLQWSIDNIVYHKLGNGEFVGWEFRNDSGNNEIKQLYIKASTAGVDYELLVNFKES